MMTIPRVFRRGYLTPTESSTWILFSALTIVLTSINMPLLAVLTYRGVEIQGKILEKQPNNHRYIRYSYTVDHTVYNGSGRSGCGNPDFENLQIDDTVVVSYDSLTPQSSILGNASCKLKKELYGLLIGLPIFSLFIRIMLRAARSLRS